MKESFIFMLSLPQTLMEEEGEIYLEPQATHDILLDTCSRWEEVKAEPL